MLEIYWGFMIFGVIFALVTIIFDDILGHFLDGIFDIMNVEGLDFFSPMVFIGGLTVFGGAGILLTNYSFFTASSIVIISAMVAIFISILVYFFYVKPMKNSENSTGFSIYETVGKIGEVSVPIPANGYGEVLVKMGVFNTNHIAASFDKEDIQSGDRVVIIEVKDGVLYVSRFENIK